MGYVPSSTPYPTSPAVNALNIWLGRSFVERDHWRSPPERQQHVYKYTRGSVLAWDAEEATGFGLAAGPLSSSALAYPAAPDVLHIPAGAIWTADDYDTTVDWGVWIKMEVTGVGTGYVRLAGTTGGAWSYEASQVAPYGPAWVNTTLTRNKNVVGQDLAVDMKVSVGTAVVLFHKICIQHLDQGTIGVA